MADLSYEIDVNTRNAQRGLKGLQDRVNGTSETFGRLKNAIAGIAIGGLIKSSFQMANAMRDLAAGTDIALQSIIGFSNAMAANGSTVDRARDGITDFVKNIGEAARGSSELQEAFRGAGVSLQELATLSEQDLLSGVVDGLAGVDDVATRTSIAMRLFGESFKGVDIQGLSRDLESFTAEAEESAAAVDAAGKVNQQLKNSFQILQEEIVKALQPFAEFLATLTENRERVREVVTAVLDLAAAFAALKAVTFAIAGIKSLTVALAGARVAAVALTASLAGIKKGFLAGGISGAIKSFTGLGASIASAGGKMGKARLVLGTLGRGLLRLVPVVGQIYIAFEALSLVFSLFREKIEAAWKWLVEFTSDIPLLGRAVDALNKISLFDDGSDEAQKRKVDELVAAVINGQEEVAKKPFSLIVSPEGRPVNREVIDALAEQKRKIDEISESYSKQTDSTIASLRATRDMIGLKGEEAQRIRTINQFQDEHLAKIEELKDKQAELNVEPEKNRNLIRAINEEIDQTNAVYNRQLPIVTKLAQEVKDTQTAWEASREAAEKLSQALEGSSSTLEDLKNSTRDARREFSQIGMSELERDIDNITNKINDDLARAVDKLNAARNDSNAEQIDREIQKLTNAAEEAIDTQSRLARESRDHQRSFASGWRRAFQQYQDDATNAAKKAEQIFGQTTRGIEDLIVGFAKTGKFEWEGFVADMAETLLRSELQVLIGKTFGALGFGGSAGGGAGQERGGSPSTPVYTQDVSAAGAAGRTGSLATPGINSNQGGNFLDTLTGIGSSLGLGGIDDLFSGFFATGGFIPNGKFGIAGENGPEMISGPANVTPGAGGANVTYNINAVDAASFKQLIARDPGFIHAVSEQGRRSLPQTRR